MKITLLTLLHTAGEHGSCRFFLLDVRRRAIAGPAPQQLAPQVFYPQFAAALNDPVFGVYVVTTKQHLVVTHASTNTHPQAAIDNDGYPDYFETEAAAQHWLLDQQERA